MVTISDPFTTFSWELETRKDLAPPAAQYELQGELHLRCLRPPLTPWVALDPRPEVEWPQLPALSINGGGH